MVPGAQFAPGECALYTLAALREGDSLRAMNGQPFTAPESRQDVERYIRENDVEFLFAQFVDMYGKPNAKLVPARLLDDLLSEGAGFAGFAAGAIGQQPNDPDMAAMPDITTFTPLPWRSEVARFACDVHVEG